MDPNTLATDVATLQGLIDSPGLTKSDKSFALGLIASFTKHGTLTVNQTPWVARLIQRASMVPVTVATAPPDTVFVGNFEKVIAMFLKASEKSKFPKIVLKVGGTSIILSLAGAKSITSAGSVNVKGAGKYPHNAWYGRINPNGTWTPSLKTDPTLQAAIESMLVKLAANPARVAKDYAKLTNNCCFCNKHLEVDESVAAGFGPVCAVKFGLKAEYDAALSKQLQKQYTAGESVVSTEPVKLVDYNAPANLPTFAKLVPEKMTVQELKDNPTGIPQYDLKVQGYEHVETPTPSWKQIDLNGLTEAQLEALHNSGKLPGEQLTAETTMKTALHQAISASTFQDMEFNDTDTVFVASPLTQPLVNTGLADVPQPVCFLCEVREGLLMRDGYPVCVECVIEMEAAK